MDLYHAPRSRRQVQAPGLAAASSQTRRGERRDLRPVSHASCIILPDEGVAKGLSIDTQDLRCRVAPFAPHHGKQFERGTSSTFRRRRNPRQASNSNPAAKRPSGGVFLFGVANLQR